MFEFQLRFSRTDNAIQFNELILLLISTTLDTLQTYHNVVSQRVDKGAVGEAVSGFACAAGITCGRHVIRQLTVVTRLMPDLGQGRVDE